LLLKALIPRPRISALIDIHDLSGLAPVHVTCSKCGNSSSGSVAQCDDAVVVDTGALL